MRKMTNNSSLDEKDLWSEEENEGLSEKNPMRRNEQSSNSPMTQMKKSASQLKKNHYAKRRRKSDQKRRETKTEDPTSQNLLLQKMEQIQIAKGRQKIMKQRKKLTRKRKKMRRTQRQWKRMRKEEMQSAAKEIFSGTHDTLEKAVVLRLAPSCRQSQLLFAARADGQHLPWCGTGRTAPNCPTL